MKYESAMEWAEELRSGRRQQGRRRLTTIDDDKSEHCCLGVRCAMYAEKGQLSVRYTPSGMGKCYGIDLEDTYLPIEVIREDEFQNRNPIIVIPRGLRDNSYGRLSLSALNDAGFTFAQIADLIEYFWEEL